MYSNNISQASLQRSQRLHTSLLCECLQHGESMWSDNNTSLFAYPNPVQFIARIKDDGTRKKHKMRT